MVEKNKAWSKNWDLTYVLDNAAEKSEGTMICGVCGQVCGDDWHVGRLERKATGKARL